MTVDQLVEVEAERRQTNKVTLDVIIEWENAKLAELDRARQMLERLAEQSTAPEIADEFDVNVAIYYDADEVDMSVLRTIIDQAGIDRVPGFRYELRAGGGLDYFAQKNAGVAASNADVILFLDSDVIPDEGWMSTLLGTFRTNPDVQIVCSRAYLATETLYDKAFSVFWFFPQKMEKSELRTVQTFQANSVAFRREVLADNPFPSLNTFRGACADVARALRDQGIDIYQQTGATLEHPAPNGMSHFINRALVQGHDQIVNAKRRKGLLHANPVVSIAKYFKFLGSAIYQVLQPDVRKRADVNLVAVPAIVGLAFIYYTIRLFGEFAAFVAPNSFRKLVSM